MELVYFKDIWIDHEAQYRWLQFDYQIGVFISRSSVNLVKFNKIWLLSLLQFVNVVIVLTEVLTYDAPWIWIMFAGTSGDVSDKNSHNFLCSHCQIYVMRKTYFAVVLWEGLISGCAYVNTYFRMSVEVPQDLRKFALGVAPVADALGILLAGLLAIPTHNAICKLPMPHRQWIN